MISITRSLRAGLRNGLALISGRKNTITIHETYNPVTDDWTTWQLRTTVRHLYGRWWLLQLVLTVEGNNTRVFKPRFHNFELPIFSLHRWQRHMPF